ncbi:MAG: SLC13 family permease [Hyphomicrobiaceae bacterium]
MSILQVEAMLVALAMLGLFMWGRWRYDLVAVAVLLTAIGLGVVKTDKAFDGFSHPVIVIIAAVLVISKAISRSGVLDGLMRRLLGVAKSTTAQVAVLTTTVSLLSAIIKNVGTLGIFMPLALQTARRSKRPASLYLMPLAFGSLIGGTITLIGTSPNLLVSAIRETATGEPFQMFDFVYVGLPLTLIAIAFLAVAWRVLPADRTPAASESQRFAIERYTTELQIEKGSPYIGKTVGDLESFDEGSLTVIAIIREAGHHYIPSRTWLLFENDILVVQGGSEAVEAITSEGKLALAGSGELETLKKELGDMEVVEAIVGSESLLVGESARSLGLRQHYETNLLAVSRAGRPITSRLQSHRFEVGDVVLLQGFQKTMVATLAELGCLPLADRKLDLGGERRGAISLGILAIALILMVLHVVPAHVAFFGAAVLIVLSRQISLKAAYESIDGSIIVMLGALIPVGESLKETGLAEYLGEHLATAASLLPGSLSVALILAVAMLVTPILHHAPAVLVMGPIAAAVAERLGYSIDPFLMAVALGAACDFLTPIGHQNNLLVMGPGGYRFGDYWRLGLPLSILVVAAGTPLILWAWPL